MLPDSRVLRVILAEDRRGWQSAFDKAPILVEIMFWGALLGTCPWDIYMEELMITELSEENLREDPWKGRNYWDSQC